MADRLDWTALQLDPAPVNSRCGQFPMTVSELGESLPVRPHVEKRTLRRFSISNRIVPWGRSPECAESETHVSMEPTMFLARPSGERIARAREARMNTVMHTDMGAPRRDQGAAS